ncbi:hypothetical protein VNO80_21473 [Phaseolus coccineus]|uniref:Uncharacterized protein n=1 Tax=Phaseolus coccineus TaxID=3886 RepID=A0AAN9M3C4_PHACN
MIMEHGMSDDDVVVWVVLLGFDFDLVFMILFGLLDGVHDRFWRIFGGINEADMNDHINTEFDLLFGVGERQLEVTVDGDASSNGADRDPVCELRLGYLVVEGDDCELVRWMRRSCDICERSPLLLPLFLRMLLLTSLGLRLEAADTCKAEGTKEN